MKVLVNGIGNIGTTLLHLLVRYKANLGITEIYGLKNSPMPWHAQDLDHLTSLGVVICSRNTEEFTDINEFSQDIDYIFDCTNNGGGLANKEWYNQLPNLIGASAQGSEKHFGTSFMSGVNNEQLVGEKYAHVVSCNTHSLASILMTFSGEDLENINSADFVIVRRSEDIGNHQRLVSANVVARHLHPLLGTHHSIDVNDLFKTIGKTITVTSSDVTTPSQLMHGVRFNINLNEAINNEKIKERIRKNSLVAKTTKFDSNIIFERGRRVGFQGRIYSHAIIIHNNLLINGNSLMGWAFIPQEGNTLISTINAFALQCNIPKHDQIMEMIKNDLLFEDW